MFGDLALRGLRLHRNVVEFHSPTSELDAFDWELVQIVDSAVVEYNAWRTWKADKEAEREGSQ